MIEYLVLRRGIVYEGTTGGLWALYPTPIISDTVCSWNEIEDLVFREDTYDPVTGIRRGRFYKKTYIQNWNSEKVFNGIYGTLIGIANNNFDHDACYEPVFVAPAKIISDMNVKIGFGTNGVSSWRVVSVETNVFKHQVFTLRARSTLGALPEFSTNLKNKDNKIIDASDRDAIVTSIDTLVNTCNRGQAEDVVDAGREATRLLLAKWIGEEANAKDLGDLIKKIDNNNNNSFIKSADLVKAAAIISRLHPRRKSSENERQKNKNNEIRPIDQDDADLTVNLIGFIIREMGWAA